MKGVGHQEITKHVFYLYVPRFVKELLFRDTFEAGLRIDTTNCTYKV